MNIYDEIQDTMARCMLFKDRLGYIRLKNILMKLRSGEYSENDAQQLLLKYF